MSKVPNRKPNMTREQVEKVLKIKGIDLKEYPVCVVAVRGYYLDSMGEKGKNDRGVFDDAAAVYSPTAFVTVNWNTDASYYRAGKGKGAEKGMAALSDGVWDYKIGLHKGRGPAGVQAGPVTVMRDGTNGAYEDVGWFGINHHWGSASGGTSSLGCQTAPPDQFPSYINTIESELKRYGKKVYKYVLIHERAWSLLNIPDDHLHEHLEPQEKITHNLQAAADIIKEFEGCILDSYKDPVGIWTIGYGTIRYPNGKAVGRGEKISKAQAEEYLLFEMSEKSAGIKKLITVPLTDSEFCALVSFAYNCGIGAFQGSTLLKKLNAGAPKIEVADELLRWVRAGGRVLNGLVRRRRAERALFLNEEIRET